MPDLTSLVPVPSLPDHALVSVIVPSYNQGRFIRDTIESTLSQSYRPLELVVIDGASTDETVQVLQSFAGVSELRWWSEPDSGVVEAVNKGFARARGQVGAIQSSDDYYLPDAVATGVEALRESEWLGFVFGDIIKVDADGRVLSEHVLNPFSIENVLSLQTWIPQPSCFFRLDLAQRLGGWRAEVPYAPDTDLWYRMMLQAEARKVDSFLAARRMHGEQRDTQGQKIIRDYTQVVQDWFDLYKAPPGYRDAAEAGLLLMQNRYAGGPPAAQLARARQAVKRYPPLAAHLQLPSPIRGLGHVKRTLHQAARWKHRMGAWLKDVPRLTPALQLPGRWIRARNRRERVIDSPEGVDATSIGPYSVDLEACEALPWIGRRLMWQACRQWPFEFRDSTPPCAAPEISFLLPHRGRERLPLLRAVVESLLAQRDVRSECLVIEQSDEQETDGLPEAVRYIHLRHPTDPVRWRKCWAYNVGALAARGRILVCHDADILVPRDYGSEIVRRFAQGPWDVLHLQRFLFCLDRGDTERLIGSRSLSDLHAPERVRQNWKGGTLAIRRDGFFQLGGFDERFVGWTGEDREFFERCQTLTSLRCGYLPFIHLWHAPQETKSGFRRQENLRFTDRILSVPPRDRVRDCVVRQNLNAATDVEEYIRQSATTSS